MINLGDIFPNFKVDTSVGEIELHSWLGDSWGILFSHPSDFTPVCTTELARAAALEPEFTARGVKMIALSCDSVQSHLEWIKDINMYGRRGCSDQLPFPIIADKDRKLAVQLQMLDPDEKDQDGLPVTARAVFIIDPKKKMRLSLLYPATTGRNFTEILRVIDSLQLTDKFKVATPADWEKGDSVMIQPTVGDEEATKMFPKGFTKITTISGKNYLRETQMPQE